MKRGKAGQLNIPFSMIFSIILIIAFVAVAIYTISVFLNLKGCSETGLFKQDLQEEVDRAWNSPETSTIKKLKLPSNIELVCFVDLEEDGNGQYKDIYEKFKKSGLKKINMFFYPLNEACEGQKGFQIKHVNITDITEKDNPYCIKNKGEIEVKIEKGFYDSLARIK